MEQTINGHAVGSLADCGCGCGNMTNSPKSVFRPGHDQKLVSKLAYEMKVAFGSGDDVSVFRLEHQARLYSPALQGKIHNAFTKAKQNTRKAATERRKALHEIAALDDLIKAFDVVTPMTVKIGRWEYPAKLNDKGLVLRNTKRDGSGEWVRHQEAQVA